MQVYQHGGNVQKELPPSVHRALSEPARRSGGTLATAGIGAVGIVVGVVMKAHRAAGIPVEIESGQHLLMANLLMWCPREGRRTGCH